jgi:hypothetical protein
MNIRRFQGLALIISALASASLLINKYTGLNRIQYISETLIIVSGVLFIFGLSGIQTVQPKTKYWGRIGLVLMAIPAIDQIVFGLIQLFVDQPLALNQLTSSIWSSLASVGVIYLGYILVGWLTIRARIYPVWVGWLLLTVGIINDAIWFSMPYVNLNFVPLSIISNFFTFIELLEIAAIIGYGWVIIRHKSFLDSNEIIILKDKGDIESLIKILQKKYWADWMFRLDAAEALAQLGIEQGVEYLTSRLQTSDTDERNEAKEILEGLNIQQSTLVLQSRK